MDVSVIIPTYKPEGYLSECLTDMGMPIAFDLDKADFSDLGSSEAGNIYISEVLHKTFIAVDENGTKAGAATAVTVAAGAALPPEEKPEPKRVYLTRPFIYMLIDSDSKIPFFIGIMRDPEN